MHVPDGYLSPAVAGASLAAVLAVLLLSVRTVSGGGVLDRERMSLFTTLSASIFVAQMLAWPIPGGTSLHLVGGALAGIMLGPWLGTLSMSLVLLVQTFVFHDGGITSIGANVLNMGVIAVLAGYVAFKAVMKLGRRAWLAGFVAGWLSLALAGLACGVELSVSWGSILPTYIMMFWHAVLGLVEGVITGSVVSYLRLKSPGIVG
ncbi:MAG: energy-coupling factor ABC transporter permease [Zestosphaera sp.]